MYDWLDNIGQKNRLKIRHIQISFFGCQFARVLGEGHGNDEPFKDVCTFGSFSLYKYKNNGAGYIREHMDLLGQSSEMAAVRASTNLDPNSARSSRLPKSQMSGLRARVQFHLARVLKSQDNVLPARNAWLQPKLASQGKREQ